MRINLTCRRAALSGLANTSQDDLSHLDISNGMCLNTTISQNVTFGEQGLPFGINLGGGKDNAATGRSISLWAASAAVLVLAFCGFSPTTL